MSKFTRRERAHIKDIVTTLSLKRISDELIIEFIVGRTGKSITVRHLARIKQSIKLDSFKWYSKMRESRTEYIAAYRERMNEIIGLQELHHTIIIRNQNSPQIQLQAAAELHRLNITLANYLDVLPEIIGSNQNATIPTAPKESNTAPTTRDTITV